MTNNWEWVAEFGDDEDEAGLVGDGACSRISDDPPSTARPYRCCL
jgi:hypothetical protein